MCAEDALGRPLPRPAKALARAIVAMASPSPDDDIGLAAHSDRNVWNLSHPDVLALREFLRTALGSPIQGLLASLVPVETSETSEELVRRDRDAR